MMVLEEALDALDQKATAAFPGLVVRKDLLRRLRSAYSVPMFMIEFLLGKYCASTDPTVIEQGMEFVRRNLAEKYVKPDEREIVKARIQQQGEFQIIDKVSVTLKEVDDKYWATLHNINQDPVRVALLFRGCACDRRPSARAFRFLRRGNGRCMRKAPGAALNVRLADKHRGFLDWGQCEKLTGAQQSQGHGQFTLIGVSPKPTITRSIRRSTRSAKSSFNKHDSAHLRRPNYA